ncbi:MAG: ATP-binding cassette domain-containing protein [Candidatus Eisenbacteria bacterium]
MHAQSVIQLDAVTKRFGSHVAVDNLSLAIPAGTVYGFIGPNGAGKTTTMRMVVDIIRPDTGTISVFGERDLSRVRHRIGYLPEERGMYKKMRTMEFAVYIGLLKGMAPADARRRVAALMDEYDLGAWKQATVDALSKGMQQKMQFIATIVHEPDLLILDEPFSGLDPVNIATMTEAVRRSRDSGRTVIFSTHMMEHAERLCDSIFMIHQGRKVLDGALSKIKASMPDRPLRVTCYGDHAFVGRLPYVKRVREFGNDLEVFLAPGASPQTLLRDIVAQVDVSRFEVAEPSLYDIFLEQVAPDRGRRFGPDGNLLVAEEAGRAGESLPAGAGPTAKEARR